MRALERAFQIAASGDYATVDSVKRQIKAEGYSAASIEGRQLIKQLRSIIAEARRQRDS